MRGVANGIGVDAIVDFIAERGGLPAGSKPA
jgi:hypothetical protein